MKKIIVLFLTVFILFSSGCASLPKQDNAQRNFTEKEKQDQAVVMNVTDTLLGAGIGLVVGILSGEGL